MNSPSFSELLDSLKSLGSGESIVSITDNWMQGRTTYGGLSAALCLQAVVNDFDDLPPLRSAQINFIGPAGGQVSITTKLMRRGRSVAYVSAVMTSEKGLETHAVFCFGARRESRLNRDFTFAPRVPSIAESSDFSDSGSRPAFTKNYDCLLAQGAKPLSGSNAHEHYYWIRHKDKHAQNLCSLIGIADMPPPAVMSLFKEAAPISSMTWMVNFLSDDIATEAGWWLVRSAAEHARDGYSSQDMQVWNAKGNLVISAMQNVAIFY